MRRITHRSEAGVLLLAAPTYPGRLALIDDERTVVVDIAGPANVEVD